jgi:GT2 family glycosyltransferase
MLRDLILRAKATFVRRFVRGGRANRSGTNANLTQGDPWILVNSFYKSAFGRLADPEELANRIHQFQLGAPYGLTRVSVLAATSVRRARRCRELYQETLAEELVGSAEFQTRHGAGQKVDVDYVTALYRDALGHQPDPAGLAYWLAEGEKGVTRAKALAAFASSEEAISRRAVPLVNALFFAAFGRTASEEELARHVQQIRSEISLEVLAEKLVSSAEFHSRYGTGGTVDTQYLRPLYRDGLGREADSQQLANWLKGEHGATRAKALAELARSDEVTENWATLFVNSLYKMAFGRLTDSEGLANRVHQLQSGVSLEVLTEQIVSSPEFLTRHGPGERLDLKYLTALYRSGFDRQPKFEELAFWLAEENKETTRKKVLAALAGSREALDPGFPSTLDDKAVYSRWIAGNDTIRDGDRAAIRAHIAGLPFRPQISVVMPIDKTSEAALHESIASVTTQLYPDWELCISFGNLAEPLLTAVLGEQEARDARIRVVQPTAVESSSAATNAALFSASGELVTFLRVGDLLSEHALYEVAIEFAANPFADVLYSDHDQIDRTGQRFNPCFKPGWDPDLLLAKDYLSNLVAYRRTFIQEIGCLRPGYEGAEFHDLALRATVLATSDRIRHVPAILYHRRDADEGNHSGDGLTDVCPIEASRRAVRDHLDSRGYNDAILEAAPQIPSANRVIWPLPEPSPLVSVIIPTRDRPDLLARCVEGVLHRTGYSNLELLIVDNESIEPATQALFEQLTREEKRVRILHHPGPFNYSALNNRAARDANGEILLLLNNDIDVIGRGWLRELTSQVFRPDVGIVGAKLLYPNEQVQHAGMVFGPEGIVVHLYRYARRDDPGYGGQLALPRTLLAVTGACLAIRRSVFFEVGGLDEINLPVVCNDVDLCLRVGRYGYRIVWTPFAELFHVECASRGLDSEDPAKRQRADREWSHLRKTWESRLGGADPFHNPNVLFHWEYHEIPSTSRRGKPWHYIVEEVSNLNQYFSPRSGTSIRTT